MKMISEIIKDACKTTIPEIARRTGINKEKLRRFKYNKQQPTKKETHLIMKTLLEMQTASIDGLTEVLYNYHK